MNKRNLRLEKYGISKNRYLELQAFCKQYPEWKEELLGKIDALASPNMDGMPRAMLNGDSTYNLAIRRAILSTKCDIVESSLDLAGSDLKEYLMASVCYGKPFAYLKGTMQIPCEQDAFYDARRYFFYILDKKVDNMRV